MGMDVGFGFHMVLVCLRVVEGLERFQQHDERLQKVENDIYYCWRQVAGEDEYIAQQASRIDTPHNQVMMYDWNH